MISHGTGIEKRKNTHPGPWQKKRLTLKRKDDMRLIYLTDMHDAFKNLERLLNETHADIYLIGGDLIYSVFPSHAKAWKFIALQEYFQKIRKMQDREEDLYTIAIDLLSANAGGEDGQIRQAENYVKLSQEARKRLLTKYDALAETFSRFSEKQIIVIPGNYDMDLDLTPLKDRNLHLRSMEFCGMKISGYGGAAVSTPGVPDHLGVQFREGPRKGTFFSEPYEFFKKEKPDICLLHQPPYGFLDTLKGQGSVGSVGIRNFIDEEAPKVVFSGHVHEAWGCRYRRGTFFLNPSNFGKYVEIHQVKKGGYFFDLILESGEFHVATLRKLDSRQILDLADYMLRDGELKKLVLDEYQINRLTGQAPRQNHIRSVSRFRRVKQFFLNYETEESRRMIRELRGIYRDIGSRGMHVAFDLLGSLNFGIADRGSDIDLIVYLRGEECLADPNDACSVPQPLKAVFDALRDGLMEIEVCDSLDLDRVEKAIRNEDSNDTHLQRFAFYRSICRPVNLRLIKEVESLLLDKPAFRRKLAAMVREYIRIMISSFRHIYSFKKYQTRLIEKGIRMPTEISDHLEKYLQKA